MTTCSWPCQSSEDSARSFCRDVLGMKEVPKPAELANRGGCWFASGEAQVHLGVQEDFRPAKKAHPALVVEGFDEILSRCEKAGVASNTDAGLTGAAAPMSSTFLGIALN